MTQEDGRLDSLVRKRIRALPVAQGRSLEELATPANLGQSSRNRIENGRRRLALDQLVTPARALDTTSDQLVENAADVVSPMTDGTHGLTRWSRVSKGDPLEPGTQGQGRHLYPRTGEPRPAERPNPVRRDGHRLARRGQGGAVHRGEHRRSGRAERIHPIDALRHPAPALPAGRSPPATRGPRRHCPRHPRRGPRRRPLRLRRRRTDRTQGSSTPTSSRPAPRTADGDSHQHPPAVTPQAGGDERPCRPGERAGHQAVQRRVSVPGPHQSSGVGAQVGPGAAADPGRAGRTRRSDRRGAAGEVPGLPALRRRGWRRSRPSGWPRPSGCARSVFLTPSAAPAASARCSPRTRRGAAVPAPGPRGPRRGSG